MDVIDCLKMLKFEVGVKVDDIRLSNRFDLNVFWQNSTFHTDTSLCGILDFHSG